MALHDVSVMSDSITGIASISNNIGDALTARNTGRQSNTPACERRESASSSASSSARNDSLSQNMSVLSARQRRRSTRACDACRKSKVRCNGVSPCNRCTIYGYSCEYLRVPKSRGRPRRNPVPNGDALSMEPHGTMINTNNRSHEVLESPQISSPSLSNNTLLEFPTSHRQHVSPAAQREQNLPEFLSADYDFSLVEIPSWTNFLTPGAPTPQAHETLDEVANYSGRAARRMSTPKINNNAVSSYDNQSSLPPHLSQLDDNCRFSPVIATEHRPVDEIRYPVLRPLVEHLPSIISIAEACKLLDYFFTDSTNSNLLTQPHSPYVLIHILRKKTFLSKQCRLTSATLLSTILFVAIQTSTLADLNITPSSKASVSEKLLDLSLRLLGPLVPSDNLEDDNFDGTTYEPSGDLDTVITYIYLGTLISAGDFKGNGRKWWKAAARLALKLGLNNELENSNALSPLWFEEMKEERRRTWWLLYMWDRHIALSFNSRPSIPQNEGDNLYLPLDEQIWQGDAFAFSDSIPRRRGPCFKMTDISLFGYFLPLMRILGEIITLHHRRNYVIDEIEADIAVKSIMEMLQTFEQSLRNVSEFLGPQPSFIARVVLCYSNHLVHVLYVLLYGKWDLISMLDDSDLWIGSPSFTTAVQHAVAAAESISQILILDPELHHMPYLWGIYLLHGSFLLVLFAEKIEPSAGANEKVISTCETALRGHEVCVATLNTEYQREFRRVLGWTLQKIRGNDSLDMARRSDNMRRSLLLYRWCKDGKGLAL